jgi:hypothetical protein
MALHLAVPQVLALALVERLVVVLPVALQQLVVMARELVATRPRRDRSSRQMFGNCCGKCAVHIVCSFRG